MYVKYVRLLIKDIFPLFLAQPVYSCISLVVYVKYVRQLVRDQMPLGLDWSLC